MGTQMSKLTEEMTADDIPEIIEFFLRGDLPIMAVARYFPEIEGNDLGELDVRLADGRLFRATFKQVNE